MKCIHKVVSIFTAMAVLVAATPAWAAKPPPPPYALNTTNWDKDINGNEIEGFDGQAYYASRYVPSLRPYMVVGTLLLLGLITVVLQNTSHHSKHSSSH